MDRFRWNQWNIAHLSRHGIGTDEAEWVIRNARYPFPFHGEDGKWFVWGRGTGGRLLQVIYVLSEDADVAYVIHARPLNEVEKRRYRRRTK